MSNPAWPIVNQKLCDIYGLNSLEVIAVDIAFRPSEIPCVFVTLRTNEGIVEIVLNVLEGKVL